MGKDRVSSPSVWFFSFGFSRHVLGLVFPRIILVLRFAEFLRILRAVVLSFHRIFTGVDSTTQWRGFQRFPCRCEVKRVQYDVGSIPI